jgi:uncharacterized membrane protein
VRKMKILTSSLKSFNEKVYFLFLPDCLQHNFSFSFYMCSFKTQLIEFIKSAHRKARKKVWNFLHHTVQIRLSFSLFSNSWTFSTVSRMTLKEREKQLYKIVIQKMWIFSFRYFLAAILPSHSLVGLCFYFILFPLILWTVVSRRTRF